MKTKTIQQIVNERRVIGGPIDRLMCVNPLKHRWAWDMLDTMENNDWRPKSIPMGDDKLCYQEKLTDGERLMYDRDLSFLSNLDGIQFDNLITNISIHVTSPEVSMVFARQAYEEANHVRAYATMIEAVSLKPEQIYGMYMTNAVLAAKNEFIMAQSDALRGDYSPEKFALAVIGNIALEGIYFFSGFLGFYVLAKRGLMLKSADQIKYIQRDELAHLAFFIHIYYTLMTENPGIFTKDFYDKARAILIAAVNLEIAWGQHSIEGGVVGLTDHIIDQRIKFLANERVASLGWEPLFPGVKNPTPWVEKFSAVNGVETNFFEGKPTDYQAGGSIDMDF
jgi:ribonucleoside-diphosphate reductase beta chain